MERRYSYVGLSVRFPRQSVWPILPGVRSFLNCERDQHLLVCFLGREMCLWYLCGDVDSSVWDVQVANDEDEAGCHDGGVEGD